MKKIISIATLILLVAVIFTGCTSGPAEQPKEPAGEQNNQEVNQEVDKEEVKLPTTDRAGNEIVVPEEINSIISMAPSIAETLIALDYGDKIIAADTQSTQIAGMPEGIEFFDLMAPDVEKLLELKPDVVFATTMSMADGTDPFKPLKDVGVCVIYIPSSNSIEAIYEDTIFMADVLQVHEKGQKIVDDMKAKINEFKEKSASVESPKTVYFEIAAAPYMYSFGSGVFLNEMIEIIGAKNALGDQESWIAVSEEAILAANPDVIITNVNYIENPTDEIKSRNGWEDITAVKNNDVYYVDNMASSLPNQNIVIALEQMAKAVYPDLY